MQVRNRASVPLILIAAAAYSISALAAEERKEGAEMSRQWSFEDVQPGKLPNGWKIEATGDQTPLATWEATEDAAAPEGKLVLSLTKPNHKSGGTYNLCWTDKVSFRDGRLVVKLRADSGKVDQGGGVIWRAKDRNNYYICRANPLEDNLRLYHVKDGKRTQIGNADLKIPSGQWHELGIEHRGTKIACSLNGKTLIEVEDGALADAGGVGLWTKADAASSFDTFQVESD